MVCRTMWDRKNADVSGKAVDDVEQEGVSVFVWREWTLKINYDDEEGIVGFEGLAHDGVGTRSTPGELTCRTS